MIGPGQSLGEAAAAGLYTGSVRQSVGLSQSVGLGLSVCNSDGQITNQIIMPNHKSF